MVKPDCVYIVTFFSAVCFLWGMMLGRETGKNKEYEKWLDRGFVMKQRRKKKCTRSVKQAKKG